MTFRYNPHRWFKVSAGDSASERQKNSDLCHSVYALRGGTKAVVYVTGESVFKIESDNENYRRKALLR